MPLIYQFDGVDPSFTSGGFRPAPDLDFPSAKEGATNPNKAVVLNPSVGLVEAVNLTGKWAVSTMFFSGLTDEQITIKLTVDGVVIWDDTYIQSGGALNLLGESSSGYQDVLPFVCDSSFVLEIQTATDTSVNFRYVARPIL